MKLLQASVLGQLVLLPCLLTAGCDRSDSKAAAIAPPAEVTVSRPLSRSVTDFLEYPGTTAPLDEVEVRARVTGFLESVHFEPRQKVERGALLFTIDKRSFQNRVSAAEASLAMTRAQLEKAQYDAERIQRLFDQDSAGEEELRAAISQRDSLAASLSADEARLEQAKLELSWCEVRAPTKGRVSRNLVDPGNVIAADTTVLSTIVNDEQVYVYCNISERDILVLRAAARRKVEASGAPASQPELRDAHWPAQVGLMIDQGHPHEGYLDYAATTVDANTGTAQVRAILPNEGGILLAGLFVRMRVPTGEPYTALTVTERALGSDQGQRFLLVVNDRNIVEYRPVKVGTLHEGLRVIESGLGPDERVVVSGIQRVRPGVTVKPIETPMMGGPVGNTTASPAGTAATSPAGGDA